MAKRTRNETIRFATMLAVAGYVLGTYIAMDAAWLFALEMDGRAAVALGIVAIWGATLVYHHDLF